ncbi:unnamed protein product [Albugo candida]|uniref:Uncharacterized protein n=1 Tax=Albugo candida TaxID=65357 RepID=A0A024GJW1_9STRA|nr:unnamed protein product [Albugo candida]|eukprot:CCI46998.1 unnamed protein product [Albugo candida]
MSQYLIGLIDPLTEVMLHAKLSYTSKSRRMIVNESRTSTFIFVINQKNLHQRRYDIFLHSPVRRVNGSDMHKRRRSDAMSRGDCKRTIRSVSLSTNTLHFKGWMENTSPLSQIHVETLSLYILFILRKIHLRICKLLQKVAEQLPHVKGNFSFKMPANYSNGIGRLYHILLTHVGRQ